MKQTVLFSIAAAMMLSGAAFADPPAQESRPQPEASIAFANRGGVDDWRADGDDVIYFKDSRRNWYKAELFGSCIGLGYTDHIGIDARPSGTLDKFGAIYVRGQRCAFRTFERVEGPPSRKGRKNRSSSAEN
ncbi:MAG: DUF6491 family protein [Novosphingobium sp.]